ncbi:hypothetical protein F3Y22_tig00110482pilonHSYRG00610 [Hibiscus syriacus]|uniref:Reverse transcriptase domain-containing protein n=1 Tax=Hibiscus syriacus TaxID=106335 RepID=A0A6A3AFX0_HIBSY|nr:hypothetical protein F3Y22_tig00110482pilonHSYRG00610 [Hibiscus syriacus]
MYGDFIFVWEPHESFDYDGNQGVSRAMQDLLDCLEGIDVIDHPFVGMIFTWCNMREKIPLPRKLDRVLLRIIGIDQLQDVLCVELSSEMKDSLVVLGTSKEIRDVLFAMDENKTLGPDGYLVVFSSTMKRWLSDLILPNQSVFFTSMDLVENVLLAQKLVKGYERKHLSARGVIKVDLRNAFDSLDWVFVFQVLKVMGFSFPIYSLLNLATKYGVIEFHPMCMRIGFTHICFVEDLLEFTKGSLEVLIVVKGIMGRFYLMSWLLMNEYKSKIFCAGLGEPEIQVLIEHTGFRVGLLPGSEGSARGARVSWEMVCHPKCESGLGLKNIRVWNSVYMMRCLSLIPVKFALVGALDGKFQAKAAWDMLQDKQDHLFAECGFARAILALIMQACYVWCDGASWEVMVRWVQENGKGKLLRATMICLAWCACIYHIWLERNGRLHGAPQKKVDDIIRMIIRLVGLRLRGYVKVPAHFFGFAADWGII